MKEAFIIMQQLVELAVASFFVGFTGAMYPGPVLIATIFHSARRGQAAGPLVTLGHALIELIITILLFFGLALVMDLVVARVVIGFIGGFTMLWMSYGTVKYSRKATLQALFEDKKWSKLLRYGPVSLGLIMSAINPYWWIWWATIGNEFLLKGFATAGIIGATIFYFSHITSDLTWNTIVSVSIGKGRRIMSDAAYKHILIICGLFLAALGAIFIVEGVNSTLTYIK